MGQLTYIVVMLPILIWALLTDVFLDRMILKKRFWTVTGIFAGAMVIFNTFLTALPIVKYNSEKISGLRLGTIPAEDFVYGFAFILTALNASRFITLLRSAPLRQILYISRPVSWVNTFFPVLAVLYFAGGSWGWEAIIILSYFLFPYNLLVYGVNDIFDYESDKLNPRKQSIQGSVVSPSQRKTTGFITASLQMMYFYLFWIFLPLESLLWLLVLIMFALSYSVPPLRMKKIPVLDSINSALHFFLPTLFAISVFNVRYVQEVLVVYGLWLVASHMLGAVPDIAYDRSTGQRTVAVWLGRQKTAAVIVMFYILCVSILFLFTSYQTVSFLLIPYVLIGMLAYSESAKHTSVFKYFLVYNLIAGAIITNLIIFRII